MDDVILHSLVEAIFPIAVAVVLPIVSIWINYRKKQHETDRRTEIVMSFIEKNPDDDIQELLDKLNPPKKPYKEQLMTMMHHEMLWGTICMIGGTATIVIIALLILLNGFEDRYIPVGAIFGVVPLAAGCGLLAAYNNAKKTLSNLNDID